MKGLPGHGVYSATKAALRSFARTWAAELADRSIRVNVLSPGYVDTPEGGDAGPGGRPHRGHAAEAAVGS